MKARVRLYGGENTILRPVIVQVIKNLIGNIGGSPDLYVYLDDNSNIVKGHSKVNKSTKTTRTTGLTKNTSNLKEFAKIVNLDDTLDEQNGNDLYFLRPDSIPILIDKDIKFSVVPIKQRRKINLSVEYSNQDRTELLSIAECLSIEQVYPGITYYHDLEYNYIIPSVINILIGNIVHCMNKSLDAMGEECIEFHKYLDKIADDRLTYTSPDTGKLKDSTLTIRERQAGVVGNMTGTVNDLKLEENDTGSYSITIEYTFAYDKVIGFDVHYPLLVFNNKISDLFIYKNKTVMASRAGIYDPAQGALMESIENIGVLATPYFKLDYLTIPYYDDVLPNTYPNYYSRIITVLIGLSPNDRRGIRNIKVMETISFKPNILKLILGSEREHVTRLKGSFIYFALYENDNLRTDIPLVLKENGDIEALEDLDLTKTYRLGMFILKDFNYMSEDDRNRLKLTLTSNLIEVSDACGKALMDYQHVNKHLIKEDINSYLIGMTNIKNQYLPDLDALADIYGLTPKDKERIAKAYPDKVSMFYRMASRESGSGLSKNVQLYSVQLNNIVNYKPKVEGE